MQNLADATVLIVKTGSPPAAVRAARGGFEDWFRVGLGLDAAQAPVVAPHDGELLPAPGSVPAVLVTGSPAYVTDRTPWILTCAAWLREVVAAGRPVLGVCFGHQLLADALGGTVGPNVGGRAFGSVRVELLPAGRGDPLFRGVAPVMDTHAAHLQSVLRLPGGARRLASTAGDPNQAIAFGERAWGVQFHPEFDADIVRRYAQEQSESLRGDGLDPVAIAAAARDSAVGSRILRNFLELARDAR